MGKGLPVALHIVGGGPMESFLRERAAELKVTDFVHFYGEQRNPYRYMKNADLFLMSSYH
jgi:glycosyltransferase involved in cell wall biosynthesis